MEDMNIREIENELVEEFEMFEDWMEKYNYLIDLGKNLEGLSDAQKTEENLVTGCQSQVWLHAELKDGKVIYHADSDALIPKGIVSILLRVLSGHTPKSILDAELGFIKEIGLEEHLSPNRANGLMSMVSQMKKYALVFQSQMN
jgi:cysteine desulfuration protein SufE